MVRRLLLLPLPPPLLLPWFLMAFCRSSFPLLIGTESTGFCEGLVWLPLGSVMDDISTLTSLGLEHPLWLIPLLSVFASLRLDTM